MWWGLSIDWAWTVLSSGAAILLLRFRRWFCFCLFLFLFVRPRGRGGRWPVCVVSAAGRKASKPLELQGSRLYRRRQARSHLFIELTVSCNHDPCPPELTSPKTNSPTSLFRHQAIDLWAAAAPHFPLETASGPALSWSIHTGGKAPPYDALYQRAAHAQLVVPAVKAQRQLLAVHSISWARRLCMYLSSWKLDRFSNQEGAVLSLQLLFSTSGTYLAR